MVNLNFIPYGSGIAFSPNRMYSFDRTSGPSMPIRTMLIGEGIFQATISVTQAFDPTMTVSLGFPANPQEIIPTAGVDLTIVGEYLFGPYRVSAINENLTLYLPGVSAVGTGVLFVVYG